ncbi:MAG: helix-turn-helix transcriptional regulator [Lachnospiraceae bacterium]|nr:helix-turn-helix transcriptional regulator [Lachnospiraceae bacterium]
MTEQNFNNIFAINLRNYLNSNGMSQVELAKRLNVGTTSVYNWCNAVKTPRMDKVDKMCEIFGCKRSDLITDPAATSSPAAPANSLRRDEQDLLSYYNLLDAEDRAEVRGYAKGLVQSEKYRTDSVEEVG